MNDRVTQAAVATDCTRYVAANGNDANAGTSPTAPKTLTGASSASNPGDVICLKAGTYYLSRTFSPARNGTASAWIVYKNYGDGTVLFVWTGGTNASDPNMFHFYATSFSTAKSYIEIRGLELDGQNAATNIIKCQYSHHLRFIGNTLKNGGASGLATKHCDYLTVDSNRVYHNGYNGGWSSGISLNSHSWLDRAAGFHSFVVNNIVSGTYDSSSAHQDGNGIIIDLK